MPHGTGPPVGMPAATNDVLATWKISTRLSVGFVRYRLESLPLKIASAMLPPSGSGRVIPATTVTVSANACAAIGASEMRDGLTRDVRSGCLLNDGTGAVGAGEVAFVESQLRAGALSHA